MEMYLCLDYPHMYSAEESSLPFYIQPFESMQMKSWINIENLRSPNNYMPAFYCDLNKDKTACAKTSKKQSDIISKDGIQPPKLEIPILFINPWGNVITNFGKLKPELLGNICFR